MSALPKMFGKHALQKKAPTAEKGGGLWSRITGSQILPPGFSNNSDTSTCLEIALLRVKKGYGRPGLKESGLGFHPSSALYQLCALPQF